MKKLIITTVAATTLLSCSNVAETISEREATEITSPDNNLLNSIDNVNNKYQTNSSMKKIKPTTANKWAGRVYAAVVDGIGGYIAGPAGWIVGPLCSWAFEEHWARCTRDVHTASRPRKAIMNDSIQIPTYVADKENPMRIDSIGYYHNLVLEKLNATQHDYYNNDSTVNYELIYDDCAKASSELNIEIPEAGEKDKFVALAKIIVESVADCNDENDLQNAFDKINSYYNSVFSPDETIVLTEQVQKRIISVISEMDDESNIKQYANEIYNAIYQSGASAEEKDKAAVANSVTINSKLYWESASQQRQNFSK